jgi:uncharacterized protein (TIRG00374 family)
MLPVRGSTARLLKLATLPMAAAILVAVCLKVGLADTLSRLRHAHAPLVLAAAALSLLEETLKAWRWRYVLGFLGCQILYREALFLIFANLPVRGVASSHAGDLSKAAYLKRWHGTSLFTSISSMLIELALSLVTLLVVMLVGCVVFGTNPYHLRDLSVVGLCVAVGLLLVSRLPGWRKRLPARLGKLASEKVARAVEDALLGYARCGLTEVAVLSIASLALETAKLVSFLIICRAVGLGIPFQQVVVFLPAVMIVAKLPFTPAGLGTREAAVLFFFRGQGSDDALLAAGMLFSFVEYLAPMLVGLPLVKLLLDRILVGRCRDT